MKEFTLEMKNNSYIYKLIIVAMIVIYIITPKIRNLYIFGCIGLYMLFLDFSQKKIQKLILNNEYLFIEYIYFFTKNIVQIKLDSLRIEESKEEPFRTISYKKINIYDGNSLKFVLTNRDGVDSNQLKTLYEFYKHIGGH